MSNLENLTPPIGYHKTTLDFISKLKFKSAPNLYKRFPIEPAVSNTLPKGLEAITWHFNPQPPRQFLAIIPWGRIWGPNGSVIAPDNKLLWDVSFEYNKTPKSHPIFLQEKLPPITYTSETLAVITAQCSFNYYHWMFDVLPRLNLLRQSPVEFDRFVINRGKYYMEEYCKYQNESLDLLGIPKEKLIECNNQTHIQAKQLIVSSMAGYTAYVPKHVCQFLRNEFLQKDNIQKLTESERIFISREDATHRKLLNEEEVVHVLKKYGFKIVKLSALSFVEKIQLFNSAEVIVSPHGAGLSNIVFCNPGTKVLELFTPTYLLPCFHIISNHVNLDYYYLVGEVVPPDHTRQVHSDPIVIDIDKLKRVLDLAGIK